MKKRNLLTKDNKQSRTGASLSGRRGNEGEAPVFLWMLLIIASALAFCPPAKPQRLVITNPIAVDRTNEVISLKRNQLTIPNKNFIPQVSKGKKLLVSQPVDTNNDGTWDELLIEISLKAKATDTLQLTWVKPSKAATFRKMTAVRLSLRSDNNIPNPNIQKETRQRGFTQNIAKPYYQMEGPGIENDKVAFRAFFDYRNGKDVYGKIVDTPILDKVGVGASWHELQSWGMDIFHTGNSLSAGGLAVKEGDKIYRLGDADTSVFQTLYSGPLQAAFRLQFTGWDVGTGKQNGSEKLSLTKGVFYYRNDITVPLNKTQQLISGIANFTSKGAVYKKHNSVFSSLSSYAAQAEGTNTQLGLAILFATTDYINNKTTDTASVIPNTSYVALKPTGTKKTICFFACWEKTDSRFATQAGFEQYLQESADKLANPVRMQLIMGN